MLLGLLLVVTASGSASVLWGEACRRISPFLQGHDHYYGALLACSAIQALLVVAGYTIAALVCKDNTCGGSTYRENCLLEVMILSASAGFFLYDLPHWRPRLSLTSVVFLLHHLGTLVVLACVLLHGRGAFYILRLSAILQFNTPLLLLRYWQIEKGQNTYLTDGAFLVSYVLKLVLFTQDSLELSADPNLPSAFKIASIFALLSTIGLFPGALKMALHQHTASL